MSDAYPENYGWHLLGYWAPNLRRASQGTTFEAVGRDDLANLTVIDIRPEERHGIAAVLDAVDEAIAKTEALIAKLKAIKQGLLHDLLTRGQERRWAEAKRALFRKIEGRTLFGAVGTGLDIPLLPPGHEIVGVEISPAMLARARERAARYPGRLELVEADLTDLPFADASFDTALTVCTFCSVPDPVAGLRELFRVLRPGGRLLMFEHTASRLWPVRPLLAAMTLVSRHVARLTTEMDRDTVANVARAGFRVERVTNHYLDVVKSIEAVRGG